MFSSLTSMLPSSLQLNDDARQKSNSSGSQNVVVNVEDDEEEPEPELDAEARKAKKKKEKGASETLVFVRPPPAKSNHPLNLQVQLVPPSSRGPATGTPRGSQEAEADRSGTTDENELIRTRSNVSSRSEASQSQQSAPNYGDSTTSFSSFTSTSSTGSGRRLIVPLYNLQAHNVMTNVIVDAGTDARIAKFTKRGLEMVEMGIWECVEVWAPVKGPDGQPGAVPESAPGSRIIKKQPSALRATPESSVVSVTSVPPHHAASAEDHYQSSQPPPPLPPTEPELPPTPTPGKRNVFSKLFSKNPAAASGHARSSSTSSTATTPKASAQPRMLSPVLGSAPGSPTKSQHGKRPVSSAGGVNFGGFSMKRDRSSSPNPALLPASASASASVVDEQGMLFVPVAHSPRQSIEGVAGGGGERPKEGAPSGNLLGPVVLPATLGIQPTLNSLLPFPFPHGLVTGERSMADMQRAVGAKLPRGPAMYVWIVRKWLKPSLLQNGGSVFARLGAGETKGGLEELEVRIEWKRGKSKRSTKKDSGGAGGGDKDRSRRSSYSRLSDDDGASGGGPAFGKAKKRLSLISTSQQSHKNPSAAGHSDDEDSDPEDSETPWSAMLKVRKTKKDKDDGIKLKLGSLSPTPHHPKVVAMLKVPWPLPDVELGPTVTVHKREAHQPPEEYDEDESLRLSAEEIKDVLCSTGTWVVIKEGFGGIGRVGRKGDGWRIRA